MREIKRQLWHALFGALLAVMIIATPKIFFQSVMICLILALIYLKIMVKRGYNIPIVENYFKYIGRKGETGEGAFYFLLGALISSIFFEQLIAAVSVLVLGVSDAASTIIGANFGKVKIFGTKTLEGSFSFFITCFLIINHFFGAVPGIICGLILTPIELFGGFNDNIVIPPACSLIIAALRQLL